MPYLTTKQAADILGVNASRVRQLLLSGKLHGERMDTPRGAVWQIRREDVEAYQQTRRSS